MNYQSIFEELDSITDIIFWDDAEYFAPIFLTSKVQIEAILDRLEDKESVFDQWEFVQYWKNSIILWYRVGVYNTAARILNEQYGKINSFKRGEESRRQRQIQKYENEFEQLLSNTEIWMK